MLISSTQAMIRRNLQCLKLLVLFLLSFRIHSTNGFAAWLKCYVDLADEEEVIMNNLIIPSARARYPGVQIEVKRADDDVWQLGSSLEYDGDALTTVTARLRVPPQLTGYDVQYVMETTSGAKFVRPKMCDGRRAHAMQYSHSVTLDIAGDTETVTLIAGYATGHEAVTLTEPMVLQRIAVQEL